MLLLSVVLVLWSRLVKIVDVWPLCTFTFVGFGIAIDFLIYRESSYYTTRKNGMAHNTTLKIVSYDTPKALDA